MKLLKVGSLLSLISLFCSSHSVAATILELNPSVWLDASTLTLTDGDSVAVWADSSANGRDASQGVALRQPIYHSNVAGANNHAVVRFNSELQAGGIANQFVAFPGPLSNTETSALSLYVVAFDSGARTSANGRGSLVNTRPNGSTATGTLFGYGSNPSLQAYAHVGKAMVPTGSVHNTAIAAGGFNLMALGRDGLTSTLFNYTDTETTRSSATWNGFNPSNLTTTQLGTEGGAHYLFGDIAEVIAFERVLTASENDMIVQYLGEKYAITAAAAVPEPSGMSLLAAAALIVGARRSRSKR